jgi:hypothetical protein
MPCEQKFALDKCNSNKHHFNNEGLGQGLTIKNIAQINFQRTHVLGTNVVPTNVFRTNAAAPFCQRFNEYLFLQNLFFELFFIR